MEVKKRAVSNICFKFMFPMLGRRRSTHRKASLIPGIDQGGKCPILQEMSNSMWQHQKCTFRAADKVNENLRTLLKLKIGLIRSVVNSKYLHSSGGQFIVSSEELLLRGYPIATQVGSETAPMH